MNSQQFKKIKLPKKSGVYFFYKKKEIIYIGKATSLSDRVKSYFGKDLINTRGPAILDMAVQATSIKYKETDNVLEALILEANLIKKYQPKYNTKEKDNKSFNYVCITKPARPHDGSGAGGEEVPKVLIIRERNIFFQQYSNSSRFTLKGSDTDNNFNIVSKKYKSTFGPFPNGQQLKEAMKIIRRIFPYIDDQSSKRNNKEFYKQLGLVPDLNIASRKYQNSSRFTLKGSDATQNFDISAALKEYKNNIKNLKLFFEGKKKSIIINLKKEMVSFAKKKEFEKAGVIKKRIFALEHINDMALIKRDVTSEDAFQKVLGRGGREPVPDHSEKHFRSTLRIEAYDIAHLFGSNMVGVMTVIENGELEKSEYKKFIIKTQTSSNDTGALEEVLSRRFKHTEWGLPNLIVMDGSTAQINIAKIVLNRYQFKIPVVSVVKDDKHKAKAIMGDETIIKKYKKQILLLNSESHRFAITFHKKRRNKNFLL
jgi:excinuclease ABC subunit C